MSLAQNLQRKEIQTHTPTHSPSLPPYHHYDDRKFSFALYFKAPLHSSSYIHKETVTILIKNETKVLRSYYVLWDFSF